MRDRRAEQGAALTVGPTSVSGFRLLQRQVFGEADETLELRVKLGESARTWVVNERDWSSVVDIVDATYREILGS